jgi:ComF family protein
MNILTKKILSPLWNLFFTGICPHCDQNTLSAGQSICEPCIRLFENEKIIINFTSSSGIGVNDAHCLRCGFPDEKIDTWPQKLNIELGKEFGCIQCYDRVIYYDSFAYLFRKSEWFKKALSNLKFHGDRYMVPFFQEAIKNYWQGNRENYDYWLAVPVSALTMRQRNFNQVDLIFEPLSSYLPRGIFLRKSDSRIQSHFGRHHRFLQVGNAYQVINKRRAELKDKRLLLVDDICTSGSTVNFIAYLLKDCGAAKVDVLVFFQSSRS